MSRFARIPAVDLGILVLSALALLVGLGSNSIHNGDEARYAIVAGEILERGDPTTLTLRGEPYFNKAPLRIWMTAALGAGFGVNPWTLRLPSALMALGVVALLLRLGRAFHDVATSRWAVGIFMASTQWLHLHGARSGEMDSTLLFFWLLAVLAIVKFPEDRRWLWLCGAAIGAAGLVKHAAYIGPVGIVVVGWMVRSGTWRLLRARDLLLATVCGALVLVPWHALQIVRFGRDFLDGYLGREVVQRVTHDYRAEYGWSYYFVVLKDGFFPWSLALPFVLLGSWNDRTRWFLAGWVGLIFGLIVIGQQDLPWYVFPAYAPLALLLARGLLQAPPRLAAAVWALVGVFLVLSPSNVMHYDVHAQRALSGMIRGDLFGLLGGSAPWWPQILVGTFVLGAGVVALSNGSAASVRRAAFVFLVASLVHAAVPLRSTFRTSDLDAICAELAQEQPGRVRAAMSPRFHENDILYFAMKRTSPDFAFVGVDDPLDPRAWRVGRRDELGDQGARFQRGAWVVFGPAEELQ